MNKTQSAALFRSNQRRKLTYGLANSFFILALVSAALAENNGISLRPALGWSSWSFIRNKPKESKIEAQALAMHQNLQSHGFRYINLDDFWYLNPSVAVDKYGRWVTFKNVNAGGSGKAKVIFLYLTGVARSADILVNRRKPVTVNFPATSSDPRDFNKVGGVTIELPLSAGNNTITVANKNGPAPDFDSMLVADCGRLALLRPLVNCRE